MYQYKTYKVVWSFKIGSIGDSEGRSWSKDIIYQADFPTREAAEEHRAQHPDVYKSEWGSWRTKDSYGLCDIFYEERLEQVIPMTDEDIINAIRATCVNEFLRKIVRRVEEFHGIV